jgi:hypothetical protein
MKLMITAVMLSVSGCAGGCSKQAEPVIADSTVETLAPEESIENTEPAPSPTVEPQKNQLRKVQKVRLIHQKQMKIQRIQVNQQE